jgi:centromere protein I
LFHNKHTNECTLASSIPAKQRVTKISGLVDKICAHAYEEGLSNTSLEEIIDTITQPSHLDQASVGSLIRNLYPFSKISNPVVVRVVGSLGHGRVKPSFTAQAALLKWLIMIYDSLEDRRVLSRLYSVIFNLLDTIAIRYVVRREKTRSC